MALWVWAPAAQGLWLFCRRSLQLQAHNQALKLASSDKLSGTQKRLV
jgi:hypothetical protein